MFCSEKSGSVNIMQQMCDINDIETRQKKERKALLGNEFFLHLVHFRNIKIVAWHKSFVYATI